MLDNPAAQQGLWAIGTKVVSSFAAMLIQRTAPAPPGERQIRSAAPVAGSPPPLLRAGLGGGMSIPWTSPPTPPAPAPPAKPRAVDPQALEAWYEECRSQALPFPQAAQRLRALLRGTPPPAVPPPAA